MLTRMINCEKWTDAKNYMLNHDLKKIVVENTIVYDNKDNISHSYVHVILRNDACINAISMILPSYVQTDDSIFEYVSNHPGDWNRVFQL